MNYESHEVIQSELQAGVSYTVNRMSFGRRVELMRRVQELAPRLDFFQAGGTQQDAIQATLLSAEIDRLYVEWGLKEVSGLEIDGRSADPESLAQSGPEELFQEALRCIRRACRLSPQEIKN